MTAYEHRLVGCRPEPLGSYLKALGVLRLVAEQVDPTAVGHWDRDGFVLGTELDDEGLERFFLDDYRPTPLVSPWNGSSGFGPEGAGELHAIESSTDPRLEPYRRAVVAARTVLAEREAGDWSKEQVLARCRSVLPDACVPWIDAAAVLTDGRAVYPPLLGTGGNDGRLEFSRNFHQRVLDVLGLATVRGHDRTVWLDDALHGLGRGSGLRGRSPGQFDPGAAGGVNSAPSGGAEAVLNPWDWVLLLEGSLLLASGSARRLAAGVSGRAAAPFTVDASAGGYASANDAEGSRGELWAPLWSGPTGLPEVRRLFAEGRADWRQGHARSGLDLAKAAASLGVDRGIDAFSRHAFVERFGLSTVAVPVGRVAVAERRQVAPLAELDPWLDRVRRAGNPPAAVQAALRAVDRAAFELAAGGGAQRLLRLLVETSRLEAAVGLSTSFRERAVVPPVSGLTGSRWLGVLDPLTAGPELRLAVCLASGRDGPAGAGGLRRLLRPVDIDQRARPVWARRPAPVTGFGTRPVHVVLAAAHARRAVELTQVRGAVSGSEQAGLPTRFGAGADAALTDVADLVVDRLDPARLQDALAACLLLDWEGLSRSAVRVARPAGLVPPPLALLAPFFSATAGAAVLDIGASWRSRLAATPLQPEQDWPALLAAERTGSVFDAALRRLRIAGLQPLVRSGHSMAVDQTPGAGARLSAALLCRLAPSHRADLLEQVCPDVDLLSDRREASPVSSVPSQGDRDA